MNHFGGYPKSSQGSPQPVKKGDILPDHSKSAISVRDWVLQPYSSNREFRNFGLIPFRVRVSTSAETLWVLTTRLGPTNLCLIAIGTETLPTSGFNALDGIGTSLRGLYATELRLKVLLLSLRSDQTAAPGSITHRTPSMPPPLAPTHSTHYSVGGEVWDT